MQNRRLTRLFDRRSQRTLLVPLDHGLGQGPLPGLHDVPALLVRLAAAEANAVVLNPGMAAVAAPVLDAHPGLGLIIHLSAGSGLAVASKRRRVVGSIDAALRLGADAVSVHLNLGMHDDGPQLAELARTSERCRAVGLPLLAMTYLANGSIDPGDLGTAARMAAELGADLVKIPCPRTDTLSALVRAIPCPVVLAGGPVDGEHDMLSVAEAVLASGAAGLAVGRHVFQHAAPQLAASVLGRVLRGRLPIAAARRMLAREPEPARAAG